MDPITAFVIATLMMLLNGGILGLIHRDLPEGLRPAAFSWRLGTLLVAGGCVLLAVQHALPPGFVLPLANALLMLGLTAYWRALRQFDGEPESLHLLWPVLVGSIGIWWFSAMRPDLAARVLFASATWMVLFIACARVLHRAAIRHAVVAFCSVCSGSSRRSCCCAAPTSQQLRTRLPTSSMVAAG